MWEFISKFELLLAIVGDKDDIILVIMMVIQSANQHDNERGVKEVVKDNLLLSYYLINLSYEI